MASLFKETTTYDPIFCLLNADSEHERDELTQKWKKNKVQELNFIGIVVSEQPAPPLLPTSGVLPSSIWHYNSDKPGRSPRRRAHVDRLMATYPAQRRRHALDSARLLVLRLDFGVDRSHHRSPTSHPSAPSVVPPTRERMHTPAPLVPTRGSRR